jgi:predicted nucleic acid-binding protein
LIAYADASFLTSLYLIDPNSKAAVQTLRQHSVQVLMSEFGFIETLSAFYQRCFRKQLVRSEAGRLADNFQKDIESGFLLLRPTPEAVYSRSRTIITEWTAKFGARTGDILHIASSLELNVDVLLTFDRRQRQLSEAVGLKGLP